MWSSWTASVEHFQRIDRPAETDHGIRARARISWRHQRPGRWRGGGSPGWRAGREAWSGDGRCRSKRHRAHRRRSGPCRSVLAMVVAGSMHGLIAFGRDVLEWHDGRAYLVPATRPPLLFDFGSHHESEPDRQWDGQPDHSGDPELGPLLGGEGCVKQGLLGVVEVHPWLYVAEPAL